MYSPQDSARIQQLRAKALTGTLTLEETKEGIALLRQGRVQAAETSAKSRATKSAKNTPVNSDDLLDQLGGL
jgi:hypothetical protein